MYAIVKTGGKQYKVAVGDVLTVEKLKADLGAEVSLPALLVVDGAELTTDRTGRLLGHRQGSRADQGSEDSDPQVQEQDRVPQAAGSPSEADPRRGHRNLEVAEGGEQIWHTRRAPPAPATGVIQTPSGWE
jgi:hypothetical protein